MPEFKILRPKVKVPGFYAMVASISTYTRKNQVGNVYRYDGRHLDIGFFKTTRFARQVMHAGKQLGVGYVVTIKPNFYETDQFGRRIIRQWFCFNGENFIEVKTFVGVTKVIHSYKKAVEKLELPDVSTITVKQN